MEIKVFTIESFKGYKIFCIKRDGESAYFRCSNHCVSNGYDVDEMIYDKESNLFELKANCFWVSTIKECKSALEVWAD